MTRTQNVSEYTLVLALCLVIVVSCRSVIAEDGSLRLVGGDEISGRLEVYLEDEWGTVCSREWSTVNTRSLFTIDNDDYYDK